MADITMCNDYSCPLKEKCYRYTATANEYYQMYLTSSPWLYHDENGQKVIKCKYFWDNTNQDKDEHSI